MQPKILQEAIVMFLALYACIFSKEIGKTKKKVSLNGIENISKHNVKRKRYGLAVNQTLENSSFYVAKDKPIEKQEDASNHFRKAKKRLTLPVRKKWKRRDLEEFLTRLKLKREMLKIFAKRGIKSDSTTDLLKKLKNDKHNTFFNIRKLNIKNNLPIKNSFLKNNRKEMKTLHTFVKEWKILPKENLLDKNLKSPLQTYEIEFNFMKQDELPEAKKETIAGKETSLKTNGESTQLR